MSDFLSKARNWWWYNKLYVLIGLAVIAVLIYSFSPAQNVKKADYQVAVLTALPLPEEEYRAIEDYLSALGEDLNGDGEVSIHLKSYGVDLENPVPSGANENFQLVAGLDADLVGKVSGLFILDEPEVFQRVTNNVLAENFVPFQDGLVAGVRKDASPAYARLLDALSA